MEIMNENLNLVEILKGCQKGTKLYSTIYGEVEFIRIDKKSIDYPIDFNTFDGYTISLTSDGRCNKYYDGECTLFPSKDQRDWSKWQRPFVDGDIVTYENQIAIFKKYIKIDDGLAECYVFLDSDLNMDIDGNYYVKDLATEEEKTKLFQVIKDNGYTWDAETKTLEKLKKEKFDPKTLKHFDKVLVRNVRIGEWVCAFFSHIDTGTNRYITTATSWRYCIPYNDDTKHLVGKIDKAPEFYRYWEE